MLILYYADNQRYKNKFLFELHPTTIKRTIENAGAFIEEHLKYALKIKYSKDGVTQLVRSAGYYINKKTFKSTPARTPKAA